MKNYQIGTVLLLLAVLFAACAGTPQTKNSGLKQTETDSVIIIARRDAGGMSTRLGVPKLWDIYVDGNVVETVEKNQTVSVQIPNGTHTIYTGGNEYKSNELTFDAQSNIVSFSTYISGGVRAELRLFQKTGDNELDTPFSSQARPGLANRPGLIFMLAGW